MRTWMVLPLLAAVAACSDNPTELSAGDREAVIVAEAPGAAAPRDQRSPKRAAKKRRGRAKVGDAPPAPGQVGVHTGPGGVRMDVNIDEGGERHQVSAGLNGMAVDFNVNVTERRTVHTETAAPAPRGPRPRGRTTCKSALLAAGHSASQLVHCGGANRQCAVALLEAGHSPAQLVHCSDVSDVRCAVQVLRRGGNPSEIVHCD